MQILGRNPTSKVDILNIRDMNGEVMFRLKEDGTSVFGPTYDETDCLKILRKSISGQDAGWIPFGIRNADGENLFKSSSLGEIIISPIIKDKRTIRLFELLACVRKCECGAEKCKLPFHSYWCPKA